MIMPQRAIEGDWIGRLHARRKRLDRGGDAEASRALDAEPRMHLQQRHRLLDRERHAEQILQERERRWQVLCDWQLDDLQQLVEARWPARKLLKRQECALVDGIMASPLAYLLAELGALVILRFRIDHHIQDPDRALGDPSVGASERLRRGRVEVIVDQVRQLLQRPASRSLAASPSPALTSGCYDERLSDREPGRRATPGLGELGLQAQAPAGRCASRGAAVAIPRGAASRPPWEPTAGSWSARAASIRQGRHHAPVAAHLLRWTTGQAGLPCCCSSSLAVNPRSSAVSRPRSTCRSTWA